MDITIRDDTWYVLNMHAAHNKKNRKDRIVCGEIPGAGPYKDVRIRLHGWMWSTP